MSVPSHPAPVAGRTARAPASARETIAPVQPSKSARSHDGLLQAVDQLDRLLHELGQDGVSDAVRNSARALVARLDELLDNRFADQEQRLLALLRRDADARIRQATDTLRVDHEWITGNWRELRPMLDGIARSYCWADIGALRSAAELFTALVRDHVEQQAALLARASSMRS